MSNQRSAGAFCSITVANLTGARSLANLTFLKYGDGAQAYCIQTRKTYRLNASYGGPAASPVVIAATGGGFWIMEKIGSDGSASVESTASQAAGVSSGGTWLALPSAAAQYGAVSTSAIWAVNTTTGVSTYSGPTAKFLIEGVLSFNSNTNGEEFEMDLSINGATIGSATNTLTASQQKFSGTNNNGDMSIAHGLIVTLNNGDTVQHMIRWLLSSETVITCDNYNKTITCLA
jgi:hypothetical protein